MNPARVAHLHSLSLDGRSAAQDLITAFATHRLYALSQGDARDILAAVVSAVTHWDAEAEAAGISAAERAIGAPAFAALHDAMTLAAA